MRSRRGHVMFKRRQLRQMLSLPVVESAVCVEHMRFIPCRSCLNGKGKGEVSTDPADIERVRQYQRGEG